VDPHLLFDDSLPIHESRAPGRLDVMGGISDYAGGTCLEWPLQCATTARAQLARDGRILAYSATAQAEGWAPSIEVAASFWMALDAAGARKYLHGRNASWGAYVLGALLILRDENRLPPDFGLRLWLDSDVPSGAGVSSSASVEVATLQVLAAAFELDLDGPSIAFLGQRVENQIANAPCGIMDQMTVAVGREAHLLRLKCQPAIIEGFEALPEGVEVCGLDSGAKHSVGGGGYGLARAGAMMGRRILRDTLPEAMRGPDGALYLANIGSDIWRALRHQIPEKMPGRDFLAAFGSHHDEATSIEPNLEYSVRLPTEHPIYEAERAQRFSALLRAARHNPAARHELLQAAGELMVQSHFSYSHRCGLGSPGTDLLVQLAREAGAQAGIYGAKITGGGQGGTVAFLTDRARNVDVDAVLESIRNDYQAQSGNASRLLR